MVAASASDVGDAYDRCLAVARAHYENFPVASVLVPRRMRRHIAAVYAFARAADDFADEGALTQEHRLSLLTSWRRRLHGAASGEASVTTALAGEPEHTDAVFMALGTSIRELQLPTSLFDDLLSAFEQDVRFRRLATWSDLVDYCRRSANPVGRLVLRIAGHADARMDAWSDALCTALQLTNFWQDIGRDIGRGRLYVPSDLQHAHAADEHDLPEWPPAWRAAIRDCVARTRALFDEGRPICAAVPGRLGLEIRATWLGGARILDRIEAGGFDVLAHRPVLGAGDAAWIALRLFV